MPRIARIALFALVAATLLPACRGQVSSQPPIHPNWNMDQVTRIDAQEPSDFWEDGRGMRTWPEGTVRAAGFDGVANPCDLPEANPELCLGTDASGAWIAGLPSGMAADAALLDRGEERYGIYCTPCHDAVGTGDGMVARRGLVPPTLHTDFQRQKPLGQIYGTIKDGGALMPAYAAQIPVEDRWAITAWVRTLQISQKAPASLAKGGK